jgi:hypothetical protein
MFETNLTTRIRDAIGVQDGPRDKTLIANLRAETNRLAARGLAISGNAIHSYTNAASDELRVRAKIVWAAISRSHTAMLGRADASTLGDLQVQITEHINAQASHVQNLAQDSVRRVTERARLNSNHFQNTIATVARELIQEANVEAQFYVDNLQRAATGGSPAPAITIHGNVGTVQTGTFATAHVILTGAGRDKLVEALEALRNEVERNPEATADQKEQATELATDVIAAVKAEKTNGAKVAGLLGGLATTVQTVASLRGAWEMVRTAAIAVGLLSG